jgi:hypothetical protein
MNEVGALTGMKVRPYTFIPDGEMWVSENTFDLIKNSIPEIQEGFE